MENAITPLEMETKICTERHRPTCIMHNIEQGKQYRGVTMVQSKKIDGNIWQESLFCTTNDIGKSVCLDATWFVSTAPS